MSLQQQLVAIKDRLAALEHSFNKESTPKKELSIEEANVNLYIQDVVDDILVALDIDSEQREKPILG